MNAILLKLMKPSASTTATRWLASACISITTIIVTGCANTKPSSGNAVALAVFQIGVSTAAAVTLHKHPEATSGVRLAADVICASAHGTNVSPAAIVNDLDHSWTHGDYDWLIVKEAVNAYNLIYFSLADTNAAAPWLLATCAALNEATEFTPTAAARAYAGTRVRAALIPSRATPRGSPPPMIWPLPR